MSEYRKKVPPSQASIVGGDFVGPGEFKYIVAVGNRGLFPHGGGSILHSKWILTARHVVLIINESEEYYYFNFSGISDIIVQPNYDNDLMINYQHPGYEVKQLYCYPPSDDYLIWPTDSDLALIELKDPIPLEIGPFYLKNIEMISEQPDFGRRYKMAGWGLAGLNDDQLNTRLRKVTIRSKRVRNPSGAFRPLQQIYLKGNNKSTCKGDSGGPGVIKDSQTGREVLAGVISYGVPPYCQ